MRARAASESFREQGGWNLIQEGPSGANATRIYAHGNRVDEIVADYNYNDNQFRYHHYDARGHCILLTNQIGNLIEQYDYDAFGQPYFYSGNGLVRSETAEGNRFLFTGREWLSELRGYDYRNRLYMPQLGRFLQPDPKHFLAGDYNLYRYVHNDPVNVTDPMGLIPDPAPLNSETMGTAKWEDMPRAYQVMTTAVTGAALAGATIEAGSIALSIRGAMLARAALAGGAMAPAANKLNVQFGRTANQISHAFAHTDKLGLNRSEIQAAVRNNLSQVASQIKVNEPLNKVIQVGGQKIQYTAYKLQDGTINVGRIHELKKLDR